MGQRIGALDAKLRAWLRDESRGQQVELGQAIRQAGLEPYGQPWVSRYVTGKESKPASLDHINVIAAFFERSLEELLREIGVIGTAATARPAQRPEDADRFARLREVSDQLKALVADVEPSTETPERHRGTKGGRRTTAAPSPRRTGPRNKGS